jgi:hypothetical protein
MHSTLHVPAPMRTHPCLCPRSRPCRTSGPHERQNVDAFSAARLQARLPLPAPSTPNKHPLTSNASFGVKSLLGSNPRLFPLTGSMVNIATCREMHEGGKEFRSSPSSSAQVLHVRLWYLELIQVNISRVICIHLTEHAERFCLAVWTQTTYKSEECVSATLVTVAAAAAQLLVRGLLPFNGVLNHT